MAKEVAINKLNFEEAITLKNVIKKLKGYGVLLNKMDRQKRKFMHEAKYKESKQVVSEIEQIRIAIADPKYLMSEEVCYQGPDPQNNGKLGLEQRAMFYSTMLPENDDLFKKEGRTMEEGTGPIKLVPLSTELIMPDLENWDIPKNRNGDLIEDDEEIKRRREANQTTMKPSTSSLKEQPMPEESKPSAIDNTDYVNAIDDMVIPALAKNSNLSDPNENPEELNLNAHELDVDTRDIAEPFIPILGMEILKKIFSAEWNLRR